MKTGKNMLLASVIFIFAVVAAVILKVVTSSKTSIIESKLKQTQRKEALVLNYAKLLLLNIKIKDNDLYSKYVESWVGLKDLHEAHKRVVGLEISVPEDLVQDAELFEICIDKSGDISVREIDTITMPSRGQGTVRPEP